MTFFPRLFEADREAPKGATGSKQQLQIALSQGLFRVYLVIFVLMLVSLGSMFLMPGGNADKLKHKREESEATEGASLLRAYQASTFRDKLYNTTNTQNGDEL